MGEIVSTEGVLGGQPRIADRRISVVQIVEWIQEEEMEPETVAAEFDLNLSSIYRALAYYYEHVEKLSDYREQRETRRRESRAEQPTPETVERS
ncbi:DUF433 domain-containing protein [Halonotius pteroides]|nr:DUF433 domain-containing protein [Halonotius pteroides]